MAAGTSKHVVIVGGGASGVLLACHLLRDPNDAVRITLIEKRPVIGRGMAYSTAQPGHLLNVRATNMSAFADDPLHFCRWLAERGG
ncbi:MAG: FAD/NAD(P)-binding protein, partial [Methyloceanibacter sp.]